MVITGRSESNLHGESERERPRYLSPECLDSMESACHRQLLHCRPAQACLHPKCTHADGRQAYTRLCRGAAPAWRIAMHLAATAIDRRAQVSLLIATPQRPHNTPDILSGSATPMQSVSRAS